jgi:hypothetical protein
MPVALLSTDSMSLEPEGLDCKMLDCEVPEHAAPLAPLRDRDLKAMLELFQVKEMEAIERDIVQNLVLRYPEPCWEDEVFDFLKEFL